MAEHEFKVGDTVEKTKGDYYFVGEVRGVILKRSGVRRVAVENADGVLHIFSESQLVLRER